MQVEHTEGLMRALLTTFSWQELRHHPWRNASAVVAVMLGVALALAVHLINASALGEFASAVRSVGGQPDVELRSAQGRLDEALFARIATHPQVALAAPVLELSTYALSTANASQRVPLRVLGVDGLLVAALSPALMPVPSPGTDRLALLAPDTVFLNPAAQQALWPDRSAPANLRLQSGLTLHAVQIAGSVSAAGPPLAVLDIAAAQELFGLQGQLSRIDLRLQPGVDRAAFIRTLALPVDVSASEPGDAAQRIDNLSRAYRVNLTVLALVALFTGAFLVFSVLSLSVARRAQQFALLGVLGLTPAQRLRLVLVESLLLGALGSVAGVALGTGLAALALRLLGGDLGGGYFAGVAPSLQWDAGAAALYGLLGVVAAGMGGWWPARAAQHLPPAQTLKGLGSAQGHGPQPAVPLLLMAASVLLAQLPPVGGLALAAYLSVGLLLIGGITALPWLIALTYDQLAPRLNHRLLPLLAVERARRVRSTAAVAVSGVVAALSLAVALTVMVASFRDSVTRWLDVALPADLYVRSATSPSAVDTVYLPPALATAVAQLPGVRQLSTQRIQTLLLDASRPAVMLISRDLHDPTHSLMLVGEPLPVPPGQIGIWVSEAMVDVYGARPGSVFAPLASRLRPAHAQDPAPVFFVAGVWRDYARQTGSIAIDTPDYQRLTGDLRVNDLALWLRDGTNVGQIQTEVRQLARHLTERSDPHSAELDTLLEFSSAREIRTTSLRIFDRSFAVTYWLQAVAIGIGLFGVAASFSAQVLARRKEFGLLAHLGLTQRQILLVVAGEGAAWTAMGALAGLGLGCAVALVLVKVVNPQSFHWTMDWAAPWPRLLALCLAVVAAGTLTAALAGRAAAGRDAVLAVKEDW